MECPFVVSNISICPLAEDEVAMALMANFQSEEFQGKVWEFDHDELCEKRYGMLMSLSVSFAENHELPRRGTVAGSSWQLGIIQNVSRLCFAQFPKSRFSAL